MFPDDEHDAEEPVTSSTEHVTFSTGPVWKSAQVTPGAVDVQRLSDEEPRSDDPE